MSTKPKLTQRIKATLERHKNANVALAVCLFMIAMAYVMQIVAIRGSLPPIETSGEKDYQMAKLVAEIQQIRSDTTGSLFWLKMIALFVTVGGAVSGYLIGQSQTTQKKLDFEKKKNIDTAYQSIVNKLADKDPRLRAAAAVELGSILQSFPTEWCGDSSDDDKKRRSQYIQLTKQVLAASLAIEDHKKVRKTLTIALVLHKPWENDPAEPAKRKYADARELDMSGAMAGDAYWRRVDFSGTDFYTADLTKRSFRESILHDAQFAPANLQRAVLAKAICRRANFKTADLRDADLTEAICEGTKFISADLRGADLSKASFAAWLETNPPHRERTSFELADLRNANLTNAAFAETNFEAAKVFGCVITGAKFLENPDAWVDNSEAGDGSQIILLSEWLALHQGANGQ